MLDISLEYCFSWHTKNFSAVCSILRRRWFFFLLFSFDCQKEIYCNISAKCLLTSESLACVLPAGPFISRCLTIISASWAVSQFVVMQTCQIYKCAGNNTTDSELHISSLSSAVTSAPWQPVTGLLIMPVCTDRRIHTHTHGTHTASLKKFVARPTVFTVCWENMRSVFLQVYVCVFVIVLCVQVSTEKTAIL